MVDHHIPAPFVAQVMHFIIHPCITSLTVEGTTVLTSSLVSSLVSIFLDHDCHTVFGESVFLFMR